MRYKERKVRLYFRGDAAFASPEIYEYLEAEGLLYVIRLKANAILQRNIAHLLTRPVGRPPDHVRRFHASFSYQAGSWNKKRRVVAKVEWHPGELVPRVGFIVTNLSRPTKRVVAFYNHRGTAEQHIKECQWRSKKGPPRRYKKGPLGGCGLVPVVHGRAPRATRRALNRLTRRRAREGPVGPRGQAWAGWSVQLAVGV